MREPLKMHTILGNNRFGRVPYQLQSFVFLCSFAFYENLIGYPCGKKTDCENRLWIDERYGQVYVWLSPYFSRLLECSKLLAIFNFHTILFIIMVWRKKSTDIINRKSRTCVAGLNLLLACINNGYVASAFHGHISFETHKKERPKETN